MYAKLEIMSENISSLLRINKIKPSMLYCDL